MADELIGLQVNPESPLPEGSVPATNLLLSAASSAERMRHFPEEVYDLSAEGHLSRFVKVILGDAGAGQVRKRAFLARLQSTLQGSHFFDLDRFYGPLFGIRRTVDEMLDFDPQVGTGTTAEWDEAIARDASFRSRIEQFSKALAYGPTPTGMELIAEALLSVDCDVYESYTQADQSYQTYAELEALYGVNLLTANQEGLETDITGWVAETNATISRIATWGASGVASLRIVATAAGDASATTLTGTAGVPVTPGTTYSYTLSLRPVVGNVCRPDIIWYDAAGVVLSTTTGSTTTSSTSTLSPEVSGAAPAAAAYAAVRITNIGATAAETMDTDLHSFSKSNYADMESVPYSTLEGAELARLSGDDRRVFTIRPKRRISQREAYDLRRVINRLKPADARMVIDFEGIPLHDPIVIDSVTADSEHWEIVSSVVPDTSVNSPYVVQSTDPVEQPRPPFSGYQGEAWSYNSDMIGVSAYTEDIDGVREVLPVQRVTYADSSTRDFAADQSVLPRRMVQSGRVVSDGILVSHPYPGPRGVQSLYTGSTIVDSTSTQSLRLYADGVPLEGLVELLDKQEGVEPFQQNPENRYWVSRQSYLLDDTSEVVEVRLSADRLINYLTFEVSHFPHNLAVEIFTTDAEWVQVHQHTTNDSVPSIIPDGVEITQRAGHPQHSLPNHWTRVGARVDALNGSRLRIKMDRAVTGGVSPRIRTRTATGEKWSAEADYSLAIRSLDFGFRVTSRDDFRYLDSTPSGGAISTTRDIAGSLVQFTPHELLASSLLTEEGFWRSEPQPVNYAVVNLYVDTRGPGNGDGQVIDRFFLEPTHVGSHFTIYFSNDPEETNFTDAFYEDRVWTPIARDFTLQRGYVHIPQTRGRYWKFEFTNLSVESYESFIPISRQVKLFPRSLVEEMHRNYEKTATEVPTDFLPSLEAVRESRYSDALNALGGNGGFRDDSDSYRATEALYFPDLSRQQRLHKNSWVFGFTPWQQGDRAPRFSTKSRHDYEQVEVRHSSKTAFFVGLRSIKAYRTSWEEDDDTQVYTDTFDDFRNLEPGFTWTFEPGYMKTGTAGVAQATSRTFPSRHNVSAVQFATVQSPPSQLVPDHDFRDPALATYDWSDPDSFLKVGDAQIIYSPTDHSIINVRHVVPLPKAVNQSTGLVQPDIHPVLTYRDYEVPDEAAAAATEGGFASPLAGLSSEGRVYAAVRIVAISNLTSPLYLQIVNNADGSVLIEKVVEVQKGQTVEEYLAFDIPAANMAVRVRLIQRGKSNDAWRISSLALFEDGIIWEFSVNGGSDWYPAQSIRNNDNAVLTFPEAGNYLRYRARTSRANQWISAIKIRPWYVGTKNSRTTGNHRGPNLSVYDQDIPIHEDPLFTSWRKPIPSWWFQSSRRFPLLPVEGAPNVTEYARFYGRPITDSITESTDSVSVKILRVRAVEERMDFLNPISDVAVRKVFTFRTSISSAPTSTDQSVGTPLIGLSEPVFNRIVRAVFSRKRY